MTRIALRSLKSTFGALAAAIRASNAVERGARPRDEDLQTLGIEPAAFRRIGR